jgi:hypothetical protein
VNGDQKAKQKRAHRPFPDDLALRLVNEKFNVISVETFQNIEIHLEAWLISARSSAWFRA